jgi:hypothetical protein
VDEWLDPVSLDLRFGVKPQFLRDFHFDRQAVGIPAGFPLAIITPHGSIAREEVFDSPGKAMARMR